MTDRPRLIEVAFPLKQTSLDSVHEKNVRHGHISTLHHSHRQICNPVAILGFIRSGRNEPEIIEGITHRQDGIKSDNAGDMSAGRQVIMQVRRH